MSMDFEERARRLSDEAIRPIGPHDWSVSTTAIAQALRQLAADVLTEAAEIADEARDCAATDNADMRAELGKLYDPNCYGTGYDAGRKAAAETVGGDWILDALRSAQRLAALATALN